MTVFMKIIDGELPATKVFENENLLVIEDIAPVAPVHLLFIPKKPIPSMQDLSKDDMAIVQEIFEIAQDLAKKRGIEKSYRFLTNNGSDAGQTVFHLHFHMIGGSKLGKMA